MLRAYAPRLRPPQTDAAAAAKSVWFDEIDAFLWPGRNLVEGDDPP